MSRTMVHIVIVGVSQRSSTINFLECIFVDNILLQTFLMELGKVNLTDFLFETEMLLEIEMLYFISTVLICTTLCTILKAKKYAV